MGKFLLMHYLQSSSLFYIFINLRNSSFLEGVRRCYVHLPWHMTYWILNSIQSCGTAATPGVNLNMNWLNISDVLTIVATFFLIQIHVTGDENVVREIGHNNSMRLTLTANSGSGGRSCSSIILVTVKL